MNLKRLLGNLDYSLVLAVCLLSIFGIICISSATHVNLGEDPGDFYMQIVFFAVGLILMVIVCMVDLNFMSQFVKIFFIINLILLLSVLIIGTEVNGAKRWIRIGPASIQPSEFCKVIMIFCMAKFIENKGDRLNTLPALGSIAICTLLPIGIIQLQHSLSASLVVFAIVCIQLFVAGLSMKIILKTLAVVLPIGGLCLWDILRADPIIMDKILYSHQINRIVTFFHPDPSSDSYYQTMKSISAIGSGQFSGKGLYHGTLNQLSYLPEPHNDFIFSVIGEEFGFVGCVFVLLLLLFIIFRCVIIAMGCRDRFSQLVVAGVAGMIAFQSFVNMAVATGLIPNTGMSLPFVSYGGSSMWTNLIAIGLVLNIGIRQTRSLFEGV